jgi:hypothetical protein
LVLVVVAKNKSREEKKRSTIIKIHPQFVTVDNSQVFVSSPVLSSLLSRVCLCTKNARMSLTYTHTHAACSSTPVPLAVNVVIVLFLINALFVNAPRRRRSRSRDRRRRQQFWQPLELFALPLDFADAFAALAADVFCQFYEAEDVFLLRG